MRLFPAVNNTRKRLTEWKKKAGADIHGKKKTITCIKMEDASVGKKENDALREKEKELARKYIESESPDEKILEELNSLCKPIYLYIYNGYHLKIPSMSVDDYLMIGYLTLWKVLENCRKRPDIINSFTAYLFVAVRHAYASEFRKYVFKNPVVLKDYEWRQVGYDYNLAKAVQPHVFS